MTEKRFALIIANNQYDDPNLSKLVAPAQDAEALERILKDPSIGGYDVRLLQNKSKSMIEEEIEAFFDGRNYDDLLLLYFSCHGIKKDGELYFATSNTKLIRPRATAVSSKFVNDLMLKCDSKRQLLLLDCCFSGAFTRGMIVKAADKHIDIKEHFEGSGRIILTSSGAMQYSFEEDKVSQEGELPLSLFTGTIVRGIETGDADIDGDGCISYNDLGKYVKSGIKQQRPEMYVLDPEGMICIAWNPYPKQAPLPPELVDAIGSPFTKIRLDAVRELGRLLRSSNKSLALEAEKNLKLLSDEDDSRMVLKAAAEILETYNKGIGSKVAEKNKKIDELNSVAQQLYNDEKYNEAIEQWNKVLELDSKNKTAKDGIEKAREELNKRLIEFNADAQKLFENKQYEEAIAKWQEVLKLNSKNSEAIGGIEKCNKILEGINTLNNSAQQLYNKGEYRNAAAKWIEVLNLDPENETAIDGIEIAIKDGIEKTIEEVNSKLKELSADTQRFLENRLYEKAIAEWEEVQELSKNLKVIEIEQAVKPEAEQKKEAEWLEAPLYSEISTIIDDLNNDAKELYNKGKYDKAIEKWNEVLKLDPENKRAKNGIINANNRKKFGYDLWPLALGSTFTLHGEKWKEVLELEYEQKREAEEAEKREIGRQETLMQEAEKRRNEGIEEAVQSEAEQEIEAERLEAPQDSEISTIIEEARSFFEMGNLQYAEAKWNEVLKLDPENREAIEGIEKIGDFSKRFWMRK